ncbi:MAG TPA: thiamine phosphate synthase [Kofleriaceae bacterium]|nr:thiamine phosphate synthase [Kofleriaceae bacterium]
MLELTERLRGFYAVLDRDDAQLARDLVGPGGARVLQIRIKSGDARTQLAVARMARPICDAVGALLIVNDRIDVALAARADGVHLGQTDVPLADARRIAPALIIGISTHTVAQVEAALEGGADYLGFGPVFATRTKQNPDPVQGIAGLRAAVAAARGTPIVAIGGIEPHAVSDIYAAGATAICAIRSVNEADDPILAARSFAATHVA